MKIFIKLMFLLTPIILLVQCKIISQHQISNGAEILKKQFCFYNNECTDSLMYSISTGDNYDDKIPSKTTVLKTRIKRISTDDDGLVIRQFINCLHIYNLYAKFNGKSTLLKQGYDLKLFFNNMEFKEYYKTEFLDQSVEIFSLDMLKEFDFFRKVESVVEESQIDIIFPNGTVLRCSKDFYDNFLFGYSLNFISKDHRIVNSKIMDKRFFTVFKYD